MELLESTETTTDLLYYPTQLTTFTTEVSVLFEPNPIHLYEMLTEEIQCDKNKENTLNNSKFELEPIFNI